MNDSGGLDMAGDATTAELREDFDHFDRNHEGLTEYGEFALFLAELEAGMSADECRIGFHEIDTDMDGAIEFGEFKAWWRAP